MTEIIEKLQLINEQKQQLIKQENVLMKFLECGKYKMTDIYNEYKKEKNIDAIYSSEDKKMFVFVCLSLCCPTFRLGNRLPARARREISGIMHVYPPQISYIIKEVRLYYHIYKPFKQEADYLYTTIKRSLT